MYKLTTGDAIIRMADGAIIANSQDNIDYLAYQDWLSDGNTPQPADQVLPSIPQEVTRFQARAALYQFGLLDDVEALIAASETDRMLVLAWQDALAFKRQSPFVQAMAQQLGLSEQQLDELFIAAAGIE